jgi:hypothetical protein
MNKKYVHGYDVRENIRLQDQASTLVELLQYDTSYPAVIQCLVGYLQGKDKTMKKNHIWSHIIDSYPGRMWSQRTYTRHALWYLGGRSVYDHIP